MTAPPRLTPAQIVALGPLAAVSPPLRRALSGSGFEPMPAPAENDWLACHPERGQKYADFIAEKPLVPEEARRTLALLPLGVPARPGIPRPGLLRDALEAFYALPARLLPRVALADVGMRTRINEHTGKVQLYTPHILTYLKRRLPPDVFALAAITGEDLYPDEAWNFVFGIASPRHRVGLFSFARYDPTFDDEPFGPGDETRILRRMIKVLLHEVGHMFGLAHCVYFLCLMNGSNHIEEADARPLHVCPICLRKLQHSIRFDVVSRYDALQRFYERAGLDDEAAWVAERLREIRD
ncbi:archaemetzincin [Polyangium sp. 6x1]|uniref:archaemetzincin n=1 Tax=Polyangium sp. 6x1 TaxID=3042689 RepID=UPI0024825D6E|nr:archaemetzincin [Polyangium sp. 6x1]MDI1446410.1 archaemetzincin [Polyangium sp. 6x1]